MKVKIFSESVKAQDVEDSFGIDGKALESDSGLEDKLALVLVQNRRLQRFAFYSAVFSLMVMLVFVGLVSYKDVNMETRLLEQKNEILTQVNSELSFVRPEKQTAVPEFVDFKIPDGVPFLGSQDAPLTVVEFADFQCPYCGFFYTDVQQRLVKDYVETGKIKFIYLDFAFLGQESIDAASAAKCANDQGKFWEYHDELFKNHNGENQSDFTRAKLIGFSKSLGMDIALFTKCFDQGDYISQVEQQTNLGQKLGINGTPTLIIGKKVIVGLRAYDDFVAEIESQLK